MEYNGQQSNELQGACELFAQFFESVYVNHSSSNCLETFNNFHNANLSKIFLSYSDVLNGISKLKSSVRSGPDGIPSFVIKNYQDSLAKPLQIIFNFSLSTGVFLDIWKFSYISPIYKAGSKNMVENYRAISKLSAIPKLFELIVRDHLYFNIKELICNEQHGFMPGRSTFTNLMLYTKFVTDAFESKFQVDTIYTDFTKAFDRICHQILISKLKTFGIHGMLLKWLNCYLTNRTQCVKLGSNYSRIIKVLSGVPQGSHLGPLLFNIFINEIPLLLKNASCLIYADDIKLFMCIKNSSDFLKLQEDLNALADWCQNNLLPLNIKKCYVFTAHRILMPLLHRYYIDDKDLERLTEIRDLGVIFDPKLSFSLHIDYIVAKANSMLGFIKRNCKEFTNPYALKSVYMCLVRPFLEYCSIVWSPSTLVGINRIERVQKAFTRFVVKQLRWTIETPSYSTRCALIGLDSLQKRRSIQCLLFVHDVFSYRVRSSEILTIFELYVPERIMRPRKFLNCPRHRTNYGCNEPFTRCINLFNNYSNEIDLSSNRIQYKNIIMYLLN